MTRNTIFFIALIFSVLLFGTACKKDATENNINLKVDFKVNGKSFNPIDQYNLGTSATPVVFNHIQFYLSSPVLRNGDASVTSSEKYHFVNESGTYNIGAFDVGSYNQLQFLLGIDEQTNHGTDPSTLTTDDALGPKNPSMHWGWAAGYRFLLVEGYYDSNGDGLATETDATFSLHLGGDAYLKTILLSTSINLGNDPATVDLNFDLGVLYSQIDLAANPSIVTLPTEDPAEADLFEQAATGFAFAFSVN